MFGVFVEVRNLLKPNKVARRKYTRRNNFAVLMNNERGSNKTLEDRSLEVSYAILVT